MALSDNSASGEYLGEELDMPNVRNIVQPVLNLLEHLLEINSVFAAKYALNRCRFS